MKRMVGVLLFLAAAVVTRGQSYYPDPDYERVLVPVYFAGPGAHGAQWMTDVRILSTDDEIELARPVLTYDEDCPILCPEAAFTTLPAWNPMRLISSHDPAGILIWIPRTAKRDTIHIEARVRDDSRSAESAGTRVPVIWERDLPEEPMVLLNVPVNGPFRTSLRLFDANQWPTSFVVRIFDMQDLTDVSATPLVDTRIQVTDPVVHIQPERFPDRPAYAAIGDLVAAYPQLRSASSIAIEITGTHLLITPPQPSNRFYALASVTNNETQEVTIIAPR